jgi:GntR family transcriptional repressor for pyruvate dehydrogenase complex
MPRLATKSVAGERGPAKADVVRMIVDLAWERGIGPGGRLPPIRDLAGALGLKPTVIRDALLEARATGRVEIVPRSGAFLADAAAAEPAPAPRFRGKDEYNLFHMLDARRHIEVELACRAAQRCRLEDLLPMRQAMEAMTRLADNDHRTEFVEQDIRFHVAVAALAGNAVLADMQRSLLEMMRPYLVELEWTSERRDRTERSHAVIYHALVAGDAEAVRAEMTVHLNMAYNTLLRDMRTAPTIASHPEDTPR